MSIQFKKKILQSSIATLFLCSSGFVYAACTDQQIGDGLNQFDVPQTSHTADICGHTVTIENLAGNTLASTNVSGGNSIGTFSDPVSFIVDGIEVYRGQDYTQTDVNNFTSAVRADSGDTPPPLIVDPPIVVPHTVVPKEEAVKSQETIIETTTKSSLKTQTKAVNNVISSHFRQLRSISSGQFAINNANKYSPEGAVHPASGLNAGSSVSGLALWFTPTYSSLNSTQANNSGGHFKQRDTSYLAGVDYVLNTQLVLGAMAGYEKSTADFNNGGDSESTGLLLAAYGAYNINSSVTLFAQAGFGNPDNEINDLNTGALISGDYNADKAFLGLGGMYNMKFNQFNVSLDSAYNWAKIDPDSYTDSVGNLVSPDATSISILSANIEIAKPVNWGEIFVLAGVDYDFESGSNDPLLESYDQFGGIIGAGLRFDMTENLFGEVSFKYDVFKDYEHGGHTADATLRYSF